MRSSDSEESEERTYTFLRNVCGRGLRPLHPPLARERAIYSASVVMAIYHLSAKVHTRASGASAVAAAAYRAREHLVDARTGEAHDYQRRGGVDGAEIHAPDDAPAWALDRSQLWNEVEAAERRKDAQVAREVVVALPVELNQQQRRTLVREFVRDEFTARGMVADVAFHGGRSHNPHAHVLLTTRRIGPDGFGKKERAWNDRALMKTWREEWGAYANRELDAAGRPERIDHRTLEAQRDEAIELGDLENAIDLDRDPQIHIGRARWAAARTGKPHPRVERGNEDAERQRDREILRARLLEQLDRLQQSIAELRRQIMDRARDFGRRRGFDWSR